MFVETLQAREEAELGLNMDRPPEDATEADVLYYTNPSSAINPRHYAPTHIEGHPQKHTLSKTFGLKVCTYEYYTFFVTFYTSVADQDAFAWVL